MIYLDNASTTPVDPEVLDAMLPYLQEQYGNPGTIYGLGRDAKKAIEKARQQVADFIGAEPRQIIFTSGGTEANNMVFFSLVNYLKSIGKRHLIVSSVEHDSVLKAAHAVCIKSTFYESYLPVNAFGCVNPKELSSLISEDTGLVSIMYMNNETGAENDIVELADVCRKKNVLFHTDCVQAAGCCVVDVNKIGCDFLSLSSHKLHGAKGCGALFVKNPEMLTPTLYGGATQEQGLRGGTENVAAIVGFGKACELMRAQLHDIDIHTSTLKQIFYTALQDRMDALEIGEALHVNGGLGIVIKHGKTLNLRFDGVDAETLLLALDSRGVCASAGSACRSQVSEPSHVLTAMGIESDDARHSVRFSFSKINTEEDVIVAATIVADCVKALKR